MVSIFLGRKIGRMSALSLDREGPSERKKERKKRPLTSLSVLAA